MNRVSTFTTLSLLILVVACQSPSSEKSPSAQSEQEEAFEFPDSLSSARLRFVMDLRKETAAKTWPDFARKRTEGALVYFNGDNSEVFFPTDKVKEKLTDFTAHSPDYWVGPRTDSIPFHFEVMISTDPSDSNKFYYDHPVEQFLSVEDIEPFIPSVNSTEMWSTMVIHEMFHHFQYNQKSFVDYGKAHIAPLDFNINNLISLCREDASFLKRIQGENELLMAAIASSSQKKRDRLIADYLKQRQERVNLYRDSLPLLERVENYYVIQEGSARYIEYHSMLVLQDWQHEGPYTPPLKDPKFDSLKTFKSIDFESADFNFLVYAGAIDYHYTIGFNTMRLLDLLGVPYKDQLLENPEKGLHVYLEEELRAKG